MSIEGAINRRYSRLLLNYPWTVILCVSALCLVLTVLGLVCTKLPDFSDPAKGFYARGTGTMTGRLLLLRELYERIRKAYNLQNFTTSTTSTTDPEDMCQDDLDNPILFQKDDDGRECVIFPKNTGGRVFWPALNLTPVSSECLMTSGQLKHMLPSDVFNSTLTFNRCEQMPALNTAYEFYFKVEKKLPFSELMKKLCLKEAQLYERFAQQKVECPLSLAGLAADLYGVRSCRQIADKQWSLFENLLISCLPLAKSGLLHHLFQGRAYLSHKSLCQNPCLSHAMHFALDKALGMCYNGQEIRSTSVWVPVNRSDTVDVRRRATEEFNSLARSTLMDDKVFRLQAVNMANSRFYAAMQSIRSDMYLIGLAISSILFISLLYTKSVVVCLVTVYNVALSLGCAYATYRLLLRISIFPYINLMGSFLLIGLSCDNVFVFDDIWLSELARGAGALTAVGSTLRHAAVALFVTSCTTSAAFFTNLFSQIVYIRMFGLYLGLSILFLFVVSVTILPAALVITHQNKPPTSTGETGICLAQMDDDARRLNTTPTVNVRMCACFRWIKNAFVPKQRQLNSAPQWVDRPPPPPKPQNGLVQTLNSKLDRASSGLQGIVFKRFLPGVIIDNAKLLVASFALFGAIGMLAVFGWPRMKFPVSSRHRFFAKTDHLMEWFEFHVRDNYRAYFDVHLEEVKNPPLLFVWGVEGRDDVSFLEPESKPPLLASQPRLNLFDPVTALWLDGFVHHFLNSSLFVEYEPLVRQWNLFRSLISNMNKSAAGKGVLCSDRDGLCFGPAEDIRRRYQHLRNSLLAKQKAGSGGGSNMMTQLKIFFLEQEDFHAFALIIRANATFNRFRSTRLYVNQLERRLASFQMNAPSQFRHCWYVSQALALFDMQRLIGQGTFQSLTAAVVIVAFALLATTANPLVTVLSIVTITFILADTIAVFVLSGWTLNFMETIIIITAVGLSVDFTVHYGVAFLHAPEETGQQLSSVTSCCRRIGGVGDDATSALSTDSTPRRFSQKEKKECNLRASIERVGPAVLMSALTTFLAGLSMCPSKLTSFSQMGFFLMLIMVVSWTYATFFFLPLCLIFGPTAHWGTLRFSEFPRVRSLLWPSPSPPRTGDKPRRPPTK